MKKELDEKLVKDFPKIFKERYEHMSKTCMCWGFPGDGWYDIIREICKEMIKIRDLTGIQFIAEQVKEKFGLLRFYFKDDGRLLKLSKKERKHWVDKIHSIVTELEAKSGTVCEFCGNPGRIRPRGWVHTFCDDCNDKHYSRRKFK